MSSGHEEMQPWAVVRTLLEGKQQFTHNVAAAAVTTRQYRMMRPSIPQTFLLARFFFEFMTVLVDAGSTLTNKVFPTEAIPEATGFG